jgi:HEAT repeat protein
MRNKYRVMLVMACLVRLCSGQTDTGRAQQLLQEIKTGTNIGDPLKELTLLAQSNPDVKAYLANQLPTAISNKQNSSVWRAEVELVGDLQLVVAIPQLVKLLIVDSEDLSPTGAYRSMALANNPPARALISIGNPAVPAVAALLQSEDKTTRSRAIRVLININTSDARSALSNHAATEKDPSLQRLIQRHS